MRLSAKKIFISVCILSMVPIILSLIRVSLYESYSYIYLNWNLFLALLPLVFSWLYVKETGGSLLGILWFILWLGFLPNAPYLITDLIHLATVGPRELIWFDALMIFNFAWVGMIAWLISVHIVYEKLAMRTFIPVISFLTAFGIYIGRYIRYNTWDFVTRPFELFETFITLLLNPLEFYPFLPYVLTFWIFLMVSYLGYRNLHYWVPQSNEEKQQV